MNIKESCNIYLNLDEYLLKADAIKADNLYISDGIFLISKEYLKSVALKNVNNSKDLFAEAIEIPYEKGEYFEVNEISEVTLRLGTKERIYIIYNDLYGFDYYLMKMIMKSLPLWKEVETFVTIDNKGEPILKFFVDEQFVGLLMCLRRDDT